MNNMSSTSFGCGHCRDAANKFIKAGIPEGLAKAKVAKSVGATEHCYSDVHAKRARAYDFGMDWHPEKFQKRLEELKATVASLEVKA